MPSGRAEEHGREHRAAAERAQRETVREALARDQQEQRADRPLRGVDDQVPDGVLPREEDLRGRLVGRLAEADREAGDHQSEHGHQEHHARLHPRAHGEREQADAAAEERRDEPEGDGIAEVRGGQVVEGRQPGDREAERAQAGERVQPEEDQRAEPGGQQARHEHEAEHGAAEAGRLEQQERAEQRRAEQRADRREAAGRRHHRGARGRRVARGQLHGQHSEPAADRDQRRLGAEHRAEGRAWRARRTPRRGARRAAAAGPCGSRRRGSGRRCRGGGGSRARSKSPESASSGNGHHTGTESNPRVLGQIGEEPLLQLVDEREEPVGDGGDGDAEQRGEGEQLEVAAAPQQRLGVRRGGRRGRSLHAAEPKGRGEGGPHLDRVIR